MKINNFNNRSRIKMFSILLISIFFIQIQHLSAFSLTEITNDNTEFSVSFFHIPSNVKVSFFRTAGNLSKNITEQFFCFIKSCDILSISDVKSFSEETNNDSGKKCAKTYIQNKHKGPLKQLLIIFLGCAFIALTFHFFMLWKTRREYSRKKIIVMKINAEGKEILNDIQKRAEALKLEFETFCDRLGEFLDVS